MRHSHPYLALGAAVALSAALAAAAAAKPAKLLTSIEVRQLAASANRGDQARLREHFDALAVRYETDARRHDNVARAVVGNPNRQLGADLAMRHRRRAESARESAAIARELAAHHARLAAGRRSTPPANSARFESGEGAVEPDETTLDAFARRARRPSDHRALAEYYTTLASRHMQKADRHVALARMYRASGMRSIVPAVHYDWLAARARDAADEARAAASKHRQIARG